MGGYRLLRVPVLTYLYICRSGRHHLECWRGALPHNVMLLNAVIENGQVVLTLTDPSWEGGTVAEPIELPIPEFRVLVATPKPKPQGQGAA